MQQGSSTANVFVTAEFENDLKIRLFKGKNVAAIKRAAKKKYPTAILQFGRVWYTNSYGAH